MADPRAGAAGRAEGPGGLAGGPFACGSGTSSPFGGAIRVYHGRWNAVSPCTVPSDLRLLRITEILDAAVGSGFIPPPTS